MTRTGADKQFVLQFEGFSLVTAKIIYRMPDHLSLLQEFIWQEYDVVPEYPQLKEFLGFWERKIEGPIHCVEVANAYLIAPVELRSIQRTEFLLN